MNRPRPHLFALFAPIALAFALPLALALAGCPGGLTEDDDDDDDGGEGEGDEGEGEEGEGEEGEGEEGEGEEGEGEEGEGEEGEGEEGEGEGACGDDLVDGNTITDTEGLVVAADGTVYYSQSGAVGRRSTDGTIDDSFVALAGASTVFGVMISPDQTRLYAASPTTQSVHVIDLASETVEFEVDGFSGANGLTVDDEGHVFVSAFSAGDVIRLTIGANADDVERLTISSTLTTPNGLLVDGDDLLVLAYSDGEFLRLTGGRVGPAPEAVIADGLGNPDGLVRAADGTFFISDNGNGRVIHVTLQDGIVVNGDIIAEDLDGAANLDFGAGALRCDRLLVTSFDTLGVLDVGVTGAPVAWR